MTARARRLAGLVTLWAVASAAAAPARSIEGVVFPSSRSALGAHFVLHGVGVLRWRILFKPYVAALYRQASTGPADVMASRQARRLEIEYFYGIAAEDFRRATVEMLARNVAAESLAAMQPQIEALNALYRDVEPGDRYALTFVPGQGTELALNGTPLGTVVGDEFGDVVHRMWLGQDPVDESLRDVLLRGS